MATSPSADGYRQYAQLLGVRGDKIPMRRVLTATQDNPAVERLAKKKKKEKN